MPSEEHIVRFFNTFLDYEKKTSKITQKDFEEFKKNLEKYISLEKLPFKIIHIAGTKGKTSLTSLLAKVFESNNYKVGTFISPHLSSYTERIKINNIPISHKTLLEISKEVAKYRSFKKENSFKTVFEILFTTSIIYFMENDVNVAIYETGLGGRLDVTNAFKKVWRIIFTPIYYDHTHLLGKNLYMIAREKGGIIKKNTKIYSFLQRKEVMQVLKMLAYKNKSFLKVFNPVKYKIKINPENQEIFIKHNSYPYKSPINIGHIKNVAFVDFLHKHKFFPDNFKIKMDSLLNMKTEGRWEIIEKNGKIFIFDGAHCKLSAYNLKRNIQTYFPNENITFVLSFLKDKNFKDFISIIYDKRYFFYYYQINYPRALKYEKLKESVFINIKKFRSIDEIKTNIVIFTGSFYFLQDMKNELLS